MELYVAAVGSCGTAFLKDFHCCGARVSCSEAAVPPGDPPAWRVPSRLGCVPATAPYQEPLASADRHASRKHHKHPCCWVGDADDQECAVCLRFSVAAHTPETAFEMYVLIWWAGFWLWKPAESVVSWLMHQIICCQIITFDQKNVLQKQLIDLKDKRKESNGYNLWLFIAQHPGSSPRQECDRPR